MDELTIDPSDATVISNRRYRRSPITTEALAFQCAHIQQGLGLEALIVGDDVGDRWVGAGDRALCRFLSKNGPELAAGERDAAMKLRALQTIREDLEGGHVTTTRIQVPNQDRFIFVTGVGFNRMRNTGVSSAAHGTKRILGYDRTPKPVEEFDAATTLQRLVDGAFARLVSAAGVIGDAPSSFLGSIDDRVYRDTLNHVLAPAVDAIAQSGVIVEDLWRQYRFRSREVKVSDGIYERTFRSGLREARSNVKLGELEVRFFHRHDAFDIPYCPRLDIRWR